MSGITYEAKAEGKVTLSEISEGKFTITAGRRIIRYELIEVEESEALIRVVVQYYAHGFDGKVTLSEISDGKFTVTAGSEKGETQITVTLNYKGENKLTVTLTVHIEDETAPTLKEEAFLKDVDLFSAEDKEKIILDFAENVNNNGPPILKAELVSVPIALSIASLQQRVFGR